MLFFRNWGWNAKDTNFPGPPPPRHYPSPACLPSHSDTYTEVLTWSVLTSDWPGKRPRMWDHHFSSTSFGAFGRPVNHRAPFLPSASQKWVGSPVLLPGKFRGWRNLVGSSLWVTKSWTQLSDFIFFLSFLRMTLCK